MSDDIDRAKGFLAQEREAALLYRRLAETVDGEERETLLRLARGEDDHAAHWESVLERLGSTGHDDGATLGWGARLTLALGRRFGLVGALPMLERHEGREIADYTDHPEATEEMVQDERDHTEMVRSLAPTWRDELAGNLRAGVFGVSDGVVSNLALVIGVFGAGAETSAVATAGIAGLVAGALSMAVGEYVSVASQQEVLTVGGTDTGQGAARQAAITSFLTFGFGAMVPLLPFLVGGGTAAALSALAATGVLLYGVGAALSLLTLRSAVRSGLRQLGLGWGAALATYVIGLALGAA